MFVVRLIRVAISVTLICTILLTTRQDSRVLASVAVSAAAYPLEVLSIPEPPKTRSTETHGQFQMILVHETAALMHTTPETFIPGIRSGQTLTQIVHTKTGWSETEYVNKLNQAMVIKLDQAVASGRLSSDQVARIKQTLPSKIQAAVTQVWKEKPRSKVEIHRGSNQINIRP